MENLDDDFLTKEESQEHEISDGYLMTIKTCLGFFFYLNDIILDEIKKGNISIMSTADDILIKIRYKRVAEKIFEIDKSNHILRGEDINTLRDQLKALDFETAPTSIRGKTCSAHIYKYSVIKSKIPHFKFLSVED